MSFGFAVKYGIQSLHNTLHSEGNPKDLPAKGRCLADKGVPMARVVACTTEPTLMAAMWMTGVGLGWAG